MPKEVRSNQSVSVKRVSCGLVVTALVDIGSAGQFEELRASEPSPSLSISGHHGLTVHQMNGVMAELAESIPRFQS